MRFLITSSLVFCGLAVAIRGHPLAENKGKLLDNEFVDYEYFSVPIINGDEVDDFEYHYDEYEAKGSSVDRVKRETEREEIAQKKELEKEVRREQVDGRDKTLELLPNPPKNPLDDRSRIHDLGGIIPRAEGGGSNYYDELDEPKKEHDQDEVLQRKEFLEERLPSKDEGGKKEHEEDERRKEEEHKDDERRKKEEHEADERQKEEEHEADDRRKEEGKHEGGKKEHIKVERRKEECPDEGGKKEIEDEHRLAQAEARKKELEEERRLFQDEARKKEIEKKRIRAQVEFRREDQDEIFKEDEVVRDEHGEDHCLGQDEARKKEIEEERRLFQDEARKMELENKHIRDQVELRDDQDDVFRVNRDEVVRDKEIKEVHHDDRDDARRKELEKKVVDHVLIPARGDRDDPARDKEVEIHRGDREDGKDEGGGLDFFKNIGKPLSEHKRTEHEEPGRVSGGFGPIHRAIKQVRANDANLPVNVNPAQTPILSNVGEQTSKVYQTIDQDEKVVKGHESHKKPEEDAMVVNARGGGEHGKHVGQVSGLSGNLNAAQNPILSNVNKQTQQVNQTNEQKVKIFEGHKSDNKPHNESEHHAPEEVEAIARSGGEHGEPVPRAKRETQLTEHDLPAYDSYTYTTLAPYVQEGSAGSDDRKSFFGVIAALVQRIETFKRSLTEPLSRLIQDTTGENALHIYSLSKARHRTTNLMHNFISYMIQVPSVKDDLEHGDHQVLAHAFGLLSQTFTQIRNDVERALDAVKDVHVRKHLEDIDSFIKEGEAYLVSQQNPQEPVVPEQEEILG